MDSHDHRDVPLVLILEDEALIGLEIADTLLDKKYRIAGPFNRCSEGLAWLADNKPDLAIVDVVLRDGFSVAVAHELRAKGVPFLVYSGRLPNGADAAFAGAPWLQKPILTALLLGTLAALSSTAPEPRTAEPNAGSTPFTLSPLFSQLDHTLAFT